MAWSGWVNTHKAAAGLTENAGSFTGKVFSTVAKPFTWTAKKATEFTWGNMKKVGNAAGHTTAAGTGALHGLIKSPAGKKLGIAALVVGGLATAGILIGKSRGAAAKAADDAAFAPISSPEQLAAEPGPVDGMAADQWRQQVAASRGTGAPAR